MQLKVRQLGLFFILALLGGCTDSRIDNSPAVLSPRAAGIRGLTPVASVHFDGSTTETQQMLVRGPTLFLTGKPFGFSIWDIGSVPTSPVLQFAYKGRITEFSSMGGWTPDDYAAGAIGTMGNFVLTSGAAGASLIDVTDKNNAREAFRYPPINGSESATPMDPRFVYRAIVAHPSQPYFYGFRSNDYVFSLPVTTAGIDQGNLKAVPYASGAAGTCCVLGGTLFQGNAFVAFRSALREFRLEINGGITQVAEYTGYNATNVVATSDFLFVQHQAIPGNTVPSGLHIFNSSRQPVAFLPMVPLRFSVSQDGQYLYANLDNDSVTIFRINWSELLGIPSR